MTADRITRHHYIFLNLLFIWLLLRNHTLARNDNALGMCYSGTHFYNDRSIKCLRNLICGLYKFQCFCRVRRLQHRYLRCDCMMAGILLILGRMHARIIRHANHHPCIYTCIGAGIERIGRYIKSDMLHAAKASFSGKTGSKSNFHGHLFIRSPFTIDLIIFCNFFCDFCTWRPRITGHHAASCLV